MSLFGRSFGMFNPGGGGRAIAPQPIILATAGMRITTRVFTDAEVKSWGVGPISLLPPIPGFWYCPIYTTLFANCTNFGGVARSGTMTYGATGQTYGGFSAVTLFSVNGIRFNMTPGGGIAIQGATDLRNQECRFVPSGSAGAAYATTGGFQIQLAYLLVKGA